MPLPVPSQPIVGQGGLITKTWYQTLSDAERTARDGLSKRITSIAAPAAATDPGVAGDIRFDSGYVYVCVAADTWKRAALSTW